MTTFFVSVNTLLIFLFSGLSSYFRILEDLVRFLVEEGGIIRFAFTASTSFFIYFLFKKLGFVASTKEERIIRICILAAIPFFILIHIKCFWRTLSTQ